MRAARILTLVILILPISVHAAVVINEIAWMGTTVTPNGSYCEWIELTNTGSESVSLSGWTLSIGATTKIFNEANGATLSIAPHGFYLIERLTPSACPDPVPGIPADWSVSFGSGISDNGTKLILSDTTGPINTIDSSTSGWTTGNKDTKETSQREADDTWITAASTPGAANADNSSSDSSDPNPDTSSDVTSTTNTTTNVTTSSSSGSATTYTPPSALMVDAGSNQNATMEVPLHLYARALTKSSVDPNAHITWGFGDGSEAEGSVVEKTYRYAGTYLVVVTATDEKVVARDEFIVTVRPAQVRILEIPDTGIVVTNDTNERLDLSGWALFADRGSFRVPDGTVLLPKANILFSSVITKLSTAPEVTLAYPNGGVAARYAVSPEPIVTTARVSALDAQPLPHIARYEQVQEVEPIISVTENVPEHAEAVSAPAVANELAAAGAVLPPPTLSVGAPTSDVGAARAFGIFKSPWALGFLGVVILAGSAFIFL